MYTSGNSKELQNNESYDQKERINEIYNIMNLSRTHNTGPFYIAYRYAQQKDDLIHTCMMT
jgi:hypothetical protein